ncbi:hypothetical protein [uncultured Muribaculum sp.]|jgi:hypothetical protein|uniref:hypothetical protein n=1 Tax=uncultured Muribaculum sp. TaxID=1918613 RepID=UPI002731663B|nr:hypothetical protein [uncultured Muribaculum sp.]
MKILYAVKNAFTDKYLAKATDSDKIFYNERQYAFHVCNAIYDIALFNSKEEAIKAYSESHLNPLNETGLIVEMIISE